MSFKVRFNEAIDPKKSPPSNLPAAGILGPDLVIFLVTLGFTIACVLRELNSFTKDK